MPQSYRADSGVVAKDDQAALERIERLFATLRQLRRSLPTCGGERELFSRACQLAVEHGKFRFAWVGIVNAAGEVVALEHAGESGDYLDGVRITTDDSPTGRGPTGTAIRERRAVICSDVATADNMAPWRERFFAFGFRSSGAFPIERGRAVYGALMLYADAPGFFQPLEQAIAEAIAAEIGVALDAADREAERREAEERLRASEERYRSILEHAADGIFVASADDYVFVEVNPAGCAMLGYSRDELVGMRLRDLVAPEAGAAQPLDFEHVELGAAFAEERRVVRKDGRRIDVEVSATRLHDGRLQAIVRDVTERKRLRAEQAATERMISLGRLAHSVGHEINNPLAYVTLSLERIRERVSALPLETKLGISLSAAEDGVGRIAHVVRALSAFGRGDTETVGPVSLSRAVSAAHSLTRNRVHHVGAVELAMEETPPVRANEFGLTQVIVNLLLNAADAMEGVARQRHVVTIASRVAADGRVVLEVRDTGPGIPAADVERIFDPFYTTKPIGKGSGVGLSISQSILASFGAALEAENRSTGGATFRILLERVDDTLPPVVATAPPPRTSAKRRVLVVDDEPLVGKAISLVLVDHEVVVCEDIASALEACRSADFDCIFCDLMMPNGSGAEFHEKLGRERPALVPRIVFMTGGAVTTASARFLERVPNLCLTKPVSSARLRSVIEETSRSRAPQG